MATACSVTLGVDTHKDLHVAVTLDQVVRRLGVASFGTDDAHHARLWAWASDFGSITQAGVEGTGSFGYRLAQFLTGSGVQVFEVNRPNRITRRRRGKSDSEDVAGEDVRRGHQDGLTRSPTDHWVSCLGSVGHAGWSRRARTDQAP